LAAQHAQAVEAEFRKYEGQGTFVKREFILRNLLGEIALTRGPRALARGQARARANIARETGRPAARRSDVAPAGRAANDSIEAIEARLRDVPLGQIFDAR
jgi:hypothetical protein